MKIKAAASSGFIAEYKNCELWAMTRDEVIKKMLIRVMFSI